jgi:hypothetical protein
MSQKYYDVSTVSSGDIKSLSYDTKIRLAEIAIKTKNNDSLKNILAVMEYPQNILVEACEYYIQMLLNLLSRQLKQVLKVSIMDISNKANGSRIIISCMMILI